MSVATGPMRALPDLSVPPLPAVPPASVPTFTPREALERRATVADASHPYSPQAQEIATAAKWVAARVTGPREELPELPRRESRRPAERRAEAPQWDLLVWLRGALVDWQPGERERQMEAPRAGEKIFAAVLAHHSGPQPVQGITPEPAPDSWRPWLAGMAFAAARWADPVGPDLCAWCRESLAGWCERCADAAEVAAAMDALHDRILTAATVTEALAMVGETAAWQATTGIAGMRAITGRDGR